MAGTAPTFYNLTTNPARNGISGGKTLKIIYDLYIALYYLCNNLDVDAGTIATDYASKIGTPLSTAGGGGGQVPLGALDSTVSLFYTPTLNMLPSGMLQSDIYTAIYDIAVAIITLCTKLDANNGVGLQTTYRSLISTPLTATLGSKLQAPAEGLITGTYFYGCDSYLAKGSFSQGDLHKCLYNLYMAVVRICAVLDAGAGTLPQTLLAGIGTPLNTAMGAFIQAPTQGATTTGT